MASPADSAFESPSTKSTAGTIACISYQQAQKVYWDDIEKSTLDTHTTTLAIRLSCDVDGVPEDHWHQGQKVVRYSLDQSKIGAKTWMHYSCWMKTGYLEDINAPRFENFEEVIQLLKDANRLWTHQWISGHGFENTIIDHAIEMLTDDIHWLNPQKCIYALLDYMRHSDTIVVGLAKFLVEWIVLGPHKDSPICGVLFKLFSRPQQSAELSNVLVALSQAITNALLLVKWRPTMKLLHSIPLWRSDPCRYHISCDEKECRAKRAETNPTFGWKQRGWKRSEDKWTRSSDAAGRPYKEFEDRRTSG
ncbi:hypothetical protein AC578_3401 [Pseudocercospora eumusae]|uniref:Uncharacterized protein n=1 Tax=Pseudocercospora eumusae TaxID=321146 RepID=A0A139H636_9PEZI|nr:hypothetical protein AC578_3401 [Pseudocercospora eumusae]